MDVNGRKFFNALEILQHHRSGKFSYQELRGWMIQNLGAVIRDLNGDGQDELIIPTVLIQYTTAETFTWPVVYKLKNSGYVRASRDFPRFYEDQILPRLEAQIRDYQAKPGQGNQDTAAALTLEKDRILRMLGRDPTAGLNHAYRWMNTDDPYLLLAATVTFSDITGHKQEAKAARAGYERALCKRHPAMVMCRNAGPQTPPGAAESQIELHGPPQSPAPELIRGGSAPLESPRPSTGAGSASGTAVHLGRPAP